MTNIDLSSHHMRSIYLTIALIVPLLVGCSILAPTEDAPFQIESPTSTITTPGPDSTLQSPGETPTPGPVTLLLWLPPELVPELNSRAGSILQEQLNEFTQRRPGVSIDVRVKDTEGSGGLVDSLNTASAAAPLALPDLVALPYEAMQASALKGLLHPFDGLTIAMDDPDWYNYAQELAHLQSSIFGLPLAGDSQVLAYRSTLIEEPPLDWETALQTPSPYVFAAADPQALFTLAQYKANGGVTQDDQGRPFLEGDKLAEVLNFFQSAEEVDLMPFWLTQFETDEQVWDAYQDNRSAMVVTWSSRFLTKASTNTALAPILTPDGLPYSLVTGWVWSLPSANPEHRELGTLLAEFLTESSFLTEWTEALGYLPPRPTAMLAWSNASIAAQLDRISVSAHLVPTQDILSSLGPALEGATVDVLKQQNNPASAVETAVESLSEP